MTNFTHADNICGKTFFFYKERESNKINNVKYLLILLFNIYFSNNR